MRPSYGMKRIAALRVIRNLSQLGHGRNFAMDAYFGLQPIRMERITAPQSNPEGIAILTRDVISPWMLISACNRTANCYYFVRHL
jgi:hypothetical protein